jgi:hypothetical protein
MENWIMNKKQKTCLWVSIAAIVVMGLFPPWVLECEKRNFLGGFGENQRFEFRYTTEPGPYSWIFAPPQAKEAFKLAPYIDEPAQGKARFVDLYRLGLQYFIVAAVTAGLIIILADKKDRKQ